MLNYLCKKFNLQLRFTHCAIPFYFRGYVDSTINTGDDVFFKAPRKFLGDKRNAYQHSLSFYMKQTETRYPYNSDEGDVILAGTWFNETLVHKFAKRPGDEFSKFTVRPCDILIDGSSLWIYASVALNRLSSFILFFSPFFFVSLVSLFCSFVCLIFPFFHLYYSLLFFPFFLSCFSFFQFNLFFFFQFICSVSFSSFCF